MRRGLRDSSLARVADLEVKLEALLGRQVDILTVDEARQNALLLAQALAEGRVLVDREGRWPRLRGEALEGIDRMLADRAG